MLSNFKLEKRLRYLSLILFLAFIIKYNYLMLQIFYAPSLTAVIIRNLFFAIFYLKFIEPLLISKKIRQRLFFMLFIFSFFFLANYWYNHYFGNFLSISDIFSGEGTGSFSMYQVLFTHIFRFRDIIIILDLALLGLGGFNSLPDLELTAEWGFWGKSMAKLPLKKTGVYALIVFLLLLQVAAGSFILGEKSPAELYQTGSSYLASVYGILPVYAIEAYSYLSREEEKPRPELENIPYYEKQKQLSGTQTLPENTNVILIQVESLDAKIVDYRQQGKEITPFLNDLKDESLYFENFYAQKVNGSFDADLSTLTSLYPVNRSYVFRDIDLSAFQSLPKLLKAENYQTLAFHNNDRNFFNRAEAYPDLGFDHFYSQRNFEEEIYPIPEQRGLGINDYDFFASAAEQLKNAAAEEQPFFAYLISLTSHTPFQFYPKNAVGDFAEVGNNLVQNYFKSINFTDRALENFISKLETAGVMDNTLLVIYSDHESEIKTLEYESGRDFTLWRNVKVPYHIPLFIKHPQLGNSIFEREGTTTDIAPTVLDLLGFQELPEQFVGKSLFLEQEDPILFLHETPHILKDGQLFIKELDNLIKVGHLKDQEREITFSEQKIEQLSEIINYMRSIFIINQGEIFREVE
ncbi:phosphoglycerol transferase MdoB-like AlkP superfamily enzyme [Halanaerobium saccharolyticum]|uniref:Phosphoglycerol transferase MdoB-like AlkP superfamily enzyme n=1 Tax=Halanaerobium saccharolyticum TaxID=43595 RepID=A0A4R7Z110_9FIRM|nr:LTA synthase family protein [Halanaerobium saccharolyticum]RAK08145.1 phosphoglycerol transferase MdoB-like AlkP superfamily enzyme [Halanaerobium saccharolyticum]TDW04352.1 phosphoglycerol transferase MdoB-like AlkP superfamily enzyme [Halanaerobium saccharolyticum]TDX59643.1 phosphoglycerol transferase MdoB-like AlkP superfamily enzyme [Halanaerobium saccharolyticum]